MTKSERNKKNYEKNRERILARKAEYDSREEIKLRKKLLARGVSA